MSMVTEREWRRRAARAARVAPRCWGAQCVKQKRALVHQRPFHALMLLVSLSLSVLTPRLLATPTPAEYPSAVAPDAQIAPRARTVREITYALPTELTYHSRTYTKEQLLRGKMLLLDSAHPLPFGAPAPNTLSVAGYGKGMAAVGDLSVKSGKETIAALTRLFAYARGRGVTGLCVWRATLTPAEQNELRLGTLLRLARKQSLQRAVERTLAQTDAPCSGELLQEYTVELRLLAQGESAPDERPLGKTEQGRFLLQNAWRYGFVYRGAGKEGELSYRFRYVGEAHAMAMTYLDLDMESYLEHLHEKRVLCIRKDGAVKHLILCAPMGETHIEFHALDGADCEASVDNTGWAILACTTP